MNHNTKTVLSTLIASATDLEHSISLLLKDCYNIYGVNTVTSIIRSNMNELSKIINLKFENVLFSSFTWMYNDFNFAEKTLLLDALSLIRSIDNELKLIISDDVYPSEREKVDSIISVLSMTTALRKTLIDLSNGNS